ncbi:NUDIX domain-containing protein [Streptomyces sp. MA5143a]|uniref:NUDIX domain-containing protein n=1 Tax=Streptomyces sp. MA5143a TaxID=2083010 RepID=UPI0021596527|nr:NUDIX domain-containing protein [Streptomyces sp. MA5143a]
MKVRHNIRAVLLDGGQLVFPRRGWPGHTSYYTTVGGGVEAEDADFEAALRREVREEIGATIGPASEFLTLTEPEGHRRAALLSRCRGGHGSQPP